MSTLRSQLRFARQAYRGARYPGDLGAELLPAPSLVRSLSASVRRGRWMIGAVGATAVAAAVMLAVVLSRVSDEPRPIRADDAQRARVDWFPTRPDALPLPRFHSPTLPPLRLDVPEVVPGVERYHDLAMQYRMLQELAPDLHLKVTVPTLSDLPTRSVEWLERVWDKDHGQQA